MRQFLILSVDLVPSSLQTFSDLPDLVLVQTFLFVVVLHVEILNHLVFVLNVLFDLVDIVGSLTVVFLFGPVLRFLTFLGSRKNVFDCVGDDEVFVRFEAMNRSFVDFRNSVLLVSAVVGEIAD